MKIDLQRCIGTFIIKKMGEKETDGERKRPEITLALAFTGSPKFLDDYMEGHLSGMTPSEVFWRQFDGKPELFERFTWLKKVELSVPENVRYRLRISTVPPDGTEADSDDYMGFRMFEVGNVELKNLSFSVMAKCAIVVAKMQFRPLHEQENELTNLRLEPSVLVSLVNEHSDLFDEANTPNEPKGGGEGALQDAKEALEDEERAVAEAAESAVEPTLE